MKKVTLDAHDVRILNALQNHGQLKILLNNYRNCKNEHNRHCFVPNTLAEHVQIRIN